MARRLAATLLCLSLAAPAFAQDGPMATAAAPAPATDTVSAASAPTDDYGYVAWCYGAISGYVDLYDRAMPEVTRIERAFPTPSTEENIAKIYPGQRDAAKASLEGFHSAMTAAEKASPRAINAAGARALAQGRGIWSGSALVKPAQLAQFWMGWAPPADCEPRAKTLVAKSSLFGQALTYNATSEAEVLSASTETTVIAPPVVEPPVAEIAPIADAPPPPAVEEPAPTPVKAAPKALAPSSIESLLAAAASGQGASADAVLRAKK